MAQDQPPEVGTVLDGYRFKGGDPKQESSWEQIAPIDVSAQYGQGARQLPNGTIERVGPRGGVQRIGSANGGRSGGSSSAMVGADARARFMINLGPLQESQRILESMDASGYSPSSLQNTTAAALEAIPFDGGYVARRAGGPDYNAYQQATKTFEAAIMPIMSGSAVTPTEAQRMIRAALPQPGDTPEVLHQKAVQRRQMINAVAQGIGHDAPYSDTAPFPGQEAGPTDPQTGLPSYPGIAPAYANVTGGMDLNGPPPAGPQGPGGHQPGGPGAGPDAAIDISDPSLDRTQLVALLANGGWVRNGSGQPYQVGAGTVREGQPAEGSTEVRPGVFQGPAPDQAAANYRSDVTGAGRQAAGFMRGVVDTATFGLSDEIGAGIDTLLPSMGGQRSGWTDGFGPAYRQNVQNYRAYANADQQDVPGARIAGQIAGGFVPGIGMAGGARTAGTGASMLRSANALEHAALAGGAYGAAYGFGSSEGSALQRLPDTGRGAAIGFAAGVGSVPVAHALSSVAGAIARPAVHALGDRAPAFARDFVRAPAPSPRSLDVQNLRAHGVSLTPGQRIGGLAQSTENLAMRAPILGPAIRGARQRGTESLNRGVGLRALDNIGEGIPASIPAGGEMVGHVGRRLGDQFDRAASMVEQVAPDEALQSGLAAIDQRKADLPPAFGEQFDNIIKQRLGRFQGPITGTQLRQIETELSGIAAQYEGAADPAQRQLGSMIDDVAGELRANLGRANPEAGAILDNASAGWADFTRMRRASVAANGRPFSPNQLSTAVRAEDGSVAKGAVGRGEARMQDLSRAAQNIMPDSFGNPGTADAAALGGIGVGMLTEPVTTTGVVAGLGAASLPYVAMGRKVIEQLPAGMRHTLNRMSDEEVGALMQAASDPARQAETIDLLAAHTPQRREARNIARVIRHRAILVTTSPQSAPQE